MDAEAKPFPNDDTTPPVTNMNLLMSASTIRALTTLIRMPSSSSDHNALKFALHNIKLAQLLGNARHIFRLINAQ